MDREPFPGAGVIVTMKEINVLFEMKDGVERERHTSRQPLATCGP